MPRTTAVCTNAKCYALAFDTTSTPGFCPECSSPVIQSCPHCGAALSEDALWANFCIQCGGQLRHHPAGCKQIHVIGKPKAQHTSTSYVGRQNLTMRMKMRRFTRLTNAFSKKVDNLRWSVALHFMHYNFCRVHQTLRVTPAIEAGIADHVWSIEEMAALMEADRSKTRVVA